jgi:hypothetical protein
MGWTSDLLWFGFLRFALALGGCDISGWVRLGWAGLSRKDGWVGTELVCVKAWYDIWEIVPMSMPVWR